MRKLIQSLMEPFQDLKISTIFTCIQRILYKQCVNFSDKYCWPNFTRSLGLRNPMDKKLYCAVEFVSVIEASKLVIIKVESRSQTPSPRLRASIDM